MQPHHLMTTLRWQQPHSGEVEVAGDSVEAEEVVEVAETGEAPTTEVSPNPRFQQGAVTTTRSGQLMRGFAWNP